MGCRMWCFFLYFLSSLLMLRRARELQGEGKIVGAVSDAVFSFRKENKEESDFQNDFKIKLS